MLDLVIRDGLIVDGTGRESYPGHVGVREGRIVLFQDPPPEARQTIRARGRAVCPGFIDLHSHADLTLADHPLAPSLVHQGVTTAVTGQCGDSPAPLFPETKEEVIAAQAIGENKIPGNRWLTWKEHLDYFRQTGLSINMVPLVGQGTIRAGIMGFTAGPAPKAALGAMRDEVEKALDGGAWGLSTGLIYPPGSFAGTDELVALTEPVGRRNGFYFTHLRGEGETLLEALAEALEIGRRTGARIRISHLKAAWPTNWSKMEKALEMVQAANREGLDVMADAYPYTAGSTWLKSVLPQWAQEGDTGEVKARLADPAARKRIRAEMGGSGLIEGDGWDKVLITRAPGRPEYAGRTVADLAGEAGLEALEWLFTALIETDLAATMVIFMSDPENIKKALSHPLVVVGSDAVTVPAEQPPGGGSAHPRTFGTFPRILGRMVRDEGLFSLEEGVRKMTGLAARSLGLTNRGLIQEGMRADLVVFDPATVRDRAEYDDPFNYPEGIEAVILNGVPTLLESRHTGQRPGMILEKD